jgi:hypothetical protein
MSEGKVTVLVEMHDKTRSAEITFSRSITTRDMLLETMRNWSLPPDPTYFVTNLTKKRELLPSDQFSEKNVSDKDVLQIQPRLEWIDPPITCRTEVPEEQY